MPGLSIGRGCLERLKKGGAPKETQVADDPAARSNRVHLVAGCRSGGGRKVEMKVEKDLV